MIRVAIIAYAIERGLGSEAGSGYNFCRSMLRQPGLDITIITRRNNAEKLRSDAEFRQCHIVGYDPPRSLTWWKRKGRNVIPYYYLWQWGVARLVRTLSGNASYDVVHLYNFHTDWAPHFLKGTAPRIVWGPICHQPRLPKDYFRGLPARRRLVDVVKWATKSCFWLLDPNLRRAAASTSVILYANEDIAPPFRRRATVRQQTFGGAQFITSLDRPTENVASETVFLHVGRAVEIKGAHLALESFALFHRRGGCGRLILVGEGVLRPHLESRVVELGLTEVVEFVDWMPQSELTKIYSKADVFLYPSLGNQDTVVAEALAAKLPIICMAGSGTETMASSAGVAVACVAGAISKNIAAAMDLLSAEHLTQPQAFQARRELAGRRSRVISWENTAAAVSMTYQERQLP